MSRDYLQLNVQVMQLLGGLEDLKIEDNVDALISEKRKTMRDLLISQDVSSSVLDMLFYREVMVEKDLDDAAVLELFVNQDESSVAKRYANMMLDFYGIEYYLRKNEKPSLKHVGNIPQFDFDNAKDVKQLAFKSPYFRTMKDIKLEDYRKKMDETLFESFKPDANKPIGLDGIVGKVIVYNLLLDNLRIKNKAIYLNVDEEKIVRDFHA